MRKYFSLGIITLLVLVLAACGEKSKEDVVNKLQENVENMSGYQAQATMSLQTGEESQTFTIDIAHQKEDYYRVLLKNENDEEGSQIILRNDEGVFVLTPALNKSFKFQSEWPQNSSQPYLYQSLVNDVISDSESSFNTTENHYVFETKTNYQNNNNLPYQELYFDKKSYAPVMVKVLDKDKNPLVEVDFSQFELDPEFAEDTFEIENNMTSSLFGIPVMAEEEETESNQDFSVLYPTEKMGAELAESKEVNLENGKRVTLTYEGERHFTLVQERVDAYPTTAASPKTVAEAEPVSIDGTMGALTDKSLEWTMDGVNYYLASEELTKEEMLEVAGSVEAQAAK
ncbi:LolA family protein [Aquibacillus sediminis]|uniref:LolA family protein n=1 Tax=Aquibacillus sediminis TaxID=2574734 RepID=UPI001109844D|nr:outer membrane lipoprotein carrier protein LolA [Aquibacillus sediminis]